MISSKSKRDINNYSGWLRRTNKQFRLLDSSGRFLPKSAVEHMKSNPYPGIIKRNEDDNTDAMKGENSNDNNQGEERTED